MDLFLRCHICIMDKDHRMNFEMYTNDWILSSHAPSMVSSSSFILFCNDKNNSNSFHKLQGYFKFIYKKIIDSYIVGLLGFIISNDICNKKIVCHLLI